MNDNIINKSKKKNKSLAFAAIALVTLVIVIVITVVFNVLVGNLVSLQIDLTTNKDYSISKEARDILKAVDKEVEIVGLFDEIKQEFTSPSNSDTTFFTDLYLSGELVEGNYYYDYYMYYAQSIIPYNKLANLNIPMVMGVLTQISGLNSNIKVSYVDIDRDTLFVKTFVGDSESAKDFKKGDFIVKCGNVFKRVTSADLCRKTMAMGYYFPFAPNIDGGFLSAISYVTADKRPVIGTVINHNEDNIADTKKASEYTVLKETLNNNAFVLKEVNISTVENYNDIDIMFFLNPKTDISVSEYDRLIPYLDKGGNLIVSIDPNADVELINLNKLLAKFNLKINNDLIYASKDQTVEKYSTSYLQIKPDNEGVIPGVFTNYPMAFVPKARSITYLSNEVESLKGSIIIKTDKNAYTADYETLKQTNTGVRNIGIVSSYIGTETSKVCLFGSSSMFKDMIGAEDKNETIGLTADCVVRICSWMEKSVNYMIPVKTADNVSVTVPESSAKLIGWISIILLPVLSFGIGIFIWLRRRHL